MKSNVYLYELELYFLTKTDSNSSIFSILKYADNPRGIPHITFPSVIPFSLIGDIVIPLIKSVSIFIEKFDRFPRFVDTSLLLLMVVATLLLLTDANLSTQIKQTFIPKSSTILKVSNVLSAPQKEITNLYFLPSHTISASRNPLEFALIIFLSSNKRKFLYHLGIFVFDEYNLTSYSFIFYFKFF